MKQFLTSKDVAEQLGVTPMQIHRLVKIGRLPFVKHGRCYRFPLQAWQAWLEGQSREALANVRGMSHAE